MEAVFSFPCEKRREKYLECSTSTEWFQDLMSHLCNLKFREFS